MRSVWWHDAVLYHVYVRSFADSDGDGVGDLPGVTRHLDHLRWLGAEGIWLSPTAVSPDADFGYDVSDYRHVQPAFGGDEALDELIEAAHRVGIRVLLDLVPNHTSVEHPWFADARRGPGAQHRDWYVWAEGRDGRPPNNWLSDFGGWEGRRSAWIHDPASGQWYLSSFLPEQVDLNWRNRAVQAQFIRIIDEWFRRGADGLRIDVAHKLVVDAELRDDPAPDPDDDPVSRARGQRQTMNAELPELHDILRSWRRLADSFEPPRLLLGETYVGDLSRMAAFHGSGDELHLTLNVPFLSTRFRAPDLRGVIQATRDALPGGAWPLWCGSNHDDGRFASRWCHGDERLARCALMLLLTLPGTPLLYYGDEIGMTEVEIPETRRRDRAGGRDRGRTPMQWCEAPGGGFTSAEVEPWLPLGDCGQRSVAGQRADPTSTLHLCRDLIAARRARPALRRQPAEWLPAAEGVIAWRGGDAHAVVINLGDESAQVGGLEGRVAVGTDRSLERDQIGGRLTLPPRSGVLVDLQPLP
ncbi:MAG TPA: alpha-amylase family glycosyl hydrolase [Candidatus Binatia bacterium]|nr:alpha-amylase family glycosyl hydrolase [Candidatus Binatia bacterium]